MAGPQERDAHRARVAVIGGSGFYEFLEDPELVDVTTPYGPPSAQVALGHVGGTPVAFLPRHGAGHRYPAHRVPYRANMSALKALGVTSVLAPAAVGSLRPDWGPGTLVVPDQVIDLTRGRASTFFDSGANHIGFADPYCPHLRGAVLAASRAASWEARDGATAVVIEGPRFSTRAESRLYSSWGGDVINMTMMPEAVLARELKMCYASVALVTDHDAGTSPEEAVTAEAVFEVFASRTEDLKDVLRRTLGTLEADPTCSCQD
jgi:5'-methylthioadenosine phosphorylase